MTTPEETRTALVVEDEESWVDLLSLLLKDAGYEILRAESGRQALKLADENKLDLAIVDLGLPDGSGVDLLKKLQALPGNTRLPIIVLSAYHREEVGDLDLGDALFVSKDQGLPPLLATLQSIGAAPST